MPTKSKLVYLPSAQHDFEEIVKYHITEAGTPYARKIYATMKTAINRLRDFPLMGKRIRTRSSPKTDTENWF